MTDVWFYHLEHTSLEQALPELLDKTLARGWKALVRATERARLDQLDGWLWTYRDEAFLPHGLNDEPYADRQPVLLTTEFGNPNGAEALFLVDGAEAGDLAPYVRCMVLFDGRDEGIVAAARAQWSRIKATGAEMSYWRQEGRGWRKQS